MLKTNSTNNVAILVDSQTSEAELSVFFAPSVCSRVGERLSADVLNGADVPLAQQLAGVRLKWAKTQSGGLLFTAPAALCSLLFT